MKCCKDGCEASPMKGDHFFRVKPAPESMWVCEAHLGEVEMDPEMKAKHARYAAFFLQEKPQ